MNRSSNLQPLQATSRRPKRSLTAAVCVLLVALFLLSATGCGAAVVGLPGIFVLPAAAKLTDTDYSDVRVGSTYYFGSYEQDNLLFNGTERIEWRVLEKKDGAVLLLSSFVLDGGRFNRSSGSSVWENSEIRSWLNSSFLEVAFTDAEKAMIPLVTVTAEPNTTYSTDPGLDTEDQVFLLSAAEARYYLGSSSDRTCKATEAAAKKELLEEKGFCYWWLRTPGKSAKTAMAVSTDGSIRDYGYDMYYTKYGIRPAIWVNLDNSAVTQKAAESENLSLPKALSADIEVGENVLFGTYEQDGRLFNGKEDIEWIVIAKDDTSVLLISKYGLDCQRFHPYSKYGTTWEKCDLRAWLNSTFYNAAFSDEEQQQIVSSVCTPEMNPTTSVDPGNETTDKVFVLSAVETSYYLPTDLVRRCRPTAYALANGVMDYDGFCWWWTRTPGATSSQVVCVNDDGAIGRGKYAGYDMYYSKYAVRPSIRVRIGE